MRKAIPIYPLAVYQPHYIHSNKDGADISLAGTMWSTRTGNIHTKLLKHKMHLTPGWDNNGKPGNQVATKSLPSHKIFGRNPAIITIYVKFIY